MGSGWAGAGTGRGRRVPRGSTRCREAGFRCTPLLGSAGSWLLADSPPCSHLFPFHSLPPASPPLLCPPSLTPGSWRRRKRGIAVSGGVRTSATTALGMMDTGRLKGPLPHLSPSSLPWPLSPASVTAGAGVGGRERRKGKAEGGREERVGQGEERVWSNKAENLALICV